MAMGISMGDDERDELGEMLAGRVSMWDGRIDQSKPLLDFFRFWGCCSCRRSREVVVLYVQILAEELSSEVIGAYDVVPGKAGVHFK